VLDDPAVVEHGDERGALDRGEPVRDQHARTAGEQPVGGGDHPALGERVHPGGGLVEDDDLHVTHQEPGERDELLLPRRQRRAARAQERVEPVGQPGDPAAQAEPGDGRLEDGPGQVVVEERDVVGERAGQDLGALGDHADGGAQSLQVEVADVHASDEDRADGRLDRAGDQRGERRLPRAGAPDQRDGLSRGHGEVDVAQAEGALVVGEVEAADLDPGRTLREWQAALGLGRHGQHLAQPDHRAEPGLEVGQVVGEHRDLPDERRGDQEEREQPGGGQAAALGERDARDGHAGEQRVQEYAGPSDEPALQVDHRDELGVHGRRQPCDAGDDVRLAEAGAHVVAAGDALLEHGRVVGPGHLLDDLALRDLVQQPPDGQPGDAAQQREQEERRPPRQPGDDPHRDRPEERAEHHPQLPAHQVADLVGVVVDPVQDLADGLLAERPERLPHRGPQDVLAEPALDPVGDADPSDLAGGVDDGGTDHAQCQQRDEVAARVLDQTSGDDRAQGGADGGDRGRGQGRDGHRAAQPAPVDPSRRVVGGCGRGGPVGRGGRSQGVGHQGADATSDDRHFSPCFLPTRPPPGTPTPRSLTDRGVGVERGAQSDASASLSVALGRITAETFAASGK